MIRYLIFFLLILSAAILQIDVAALVGILPNDERISQESLKISEKSSYSKEFLIKEYDNAVKEIHKRLDQENLLFGLKFSLVGAILAILFSTHLKIIAVNIKKEKNESTIPLKYPIVTSFCWAAVITSAIVDTRILYNANLIITLGTWIKDYVEPVLLGKEITGWENYIVQKSLLFKSQAYPLLRLNANLLTLLLYTTTSFAFSGIIRESSPKSGFTLTRKICLFGSSASFIIFFLVAIHFHYPHLEWHFWCGTMTITGIAMSLLMWSPRDSQDKI